MHSQKQTWSEFNRRKRKKRMQELHLVEFIDLIPPNEEKDSSDKEVVENQKQTFFIKKLCVKSRKFPRDNNQSR